MARYRYQKGCLFIRGKTRRVWVARWREDVLGPANKVVRVLRSEVLGSAREIRTRREARLILDKRLTPINQGQQKAESTMMFAQFYREKWEPTMLPLLKKSSANYYQKLLNLHVVPYFGPKQLREIGRADVQEFLKKKRESGLSGSTVHGIRTALSKVLQTAVDWQWLENNPARGVIVGDRKPKSERQFLSASDVGRLLAVLTEPCRMIVQVAVLTGLRIGEILALRWKNVDLDRNVLRVRETVYEGRFGGPKTRSSTRDVPLSEAACDGLRAHRSRSSETGAEDLVFFSQAGTPLNPKNLMNRALRPACRQLRLPDIGWHSFRHTHATLLSEAGESLKTAQALLGHSDVETTLNIYTHAIPESQRRAVEKVAGILFPSVPNFSVAPENERPN